MFGYQLPFLNAGADSFKRTSRWSRSADKVQNIFFKGTDVFTWFNIIFLPPETAKQLKSAKVEIITVQTYEDE